jgi:hypothetical protein
MVRSSVESVSEQSSGQITPSIRQFSAPKAVREVEYVSPSPAVSDLFPRLVGVTLVASLSQDLRHSLHNLNKSVPNLEELLKRKPMMLQRAALIDDHLPIVMNETAEDRVPGS